MKNPTRPAHWWQSPIGRNILLATGILLLLLAPIVGVLPGPGGIFLVAGGAALILRASPWAKRAYVRAKRRWPRLGHLVDRVLRRASARRRRARDAAIPGARD
ncbi:MAG TPA: hypothetical protein VGC10_09655 [Sphingomonas sp.]